MENKYMNKLDKNYFKECVSEVIRYYREQRFTAESAIPELEKLYTHISGLRDTFYIFNIDGIRELQEPVVKEIERYKKELNMISMQDMSYDELKEKIENCKDTLEECLEECTTGTGDYYTLIAELIDAKNELKARKEKLHEQIIKDITDPDTMNKEEANYVSYLEFLSDSEMENHGYEEVLFEDFEEEELEKLWKESH